MKKFRGLSLILVLSLLMSVFALAACTDKEQPRELEGVEKFIVGTWETDDGFWITFNSDGTWSNSSGNKGTFKNTGSGHYGEYGRYETIDISQTTKFALLDSDPNKLYWIYDGIIQTAHPYVRQ